MEHGVWKNGIPASALHILSIQFSFGKRLQDFISMDLICLYRNVSPLAGKLKKIP